MVKNTSVSFSQGTTHSTLWTWLTSNRLLLSSLWRKDWLKGPGRQTSWGGIVPNYISKLICKMLRKIRQDTQIVSYVNATRNNQAGLTTLLLGCATQSFQLAWSSEGEKSKHETSVTPGCVLLHIVLKRVTKFKPWWCWEAAHEAGTQSDTVCLGWCRSSPWHLLAWEEWTSSVDGGRQTAGWRVGDEGRARQQREASCYISWYLHYRANDMWTPWHWQLMVWLWLDEHLLAAVTASTLLDSVFLPVLLLSVQSISEVPHWWWGQNLAHSQCSSSRWTHWKGLRLKLKQQVFKVLWTGFSDRFSILISRLQTKETFLWLLNFGTFSYLT